MPTTGFLAVKNGKYYAVLNLYDSSGKRKLKWISTGYPEKNNKRKAVVFCSRSRGLGSSYGELTPDPD